MTLDLEGCNDNYFGIPGTCSNCPKGRVSRYPFNVKIEDCYCIDFVTALNPLACYDMVDHNESKPIAEFMLDILILFQNVSIALILLVTIFMPITIFKRRTAIKQFFKRRKLGKLEAVPATNSK